MLLADWLPPIGTPQRNLALLVIAVSVLNIIALFCVLALGIFFANWWNKRDLEERKRAQLKDKLLVASERILDLAKERIEQTKTIAHEVKRDVNEIPDRTAEKVIEKIQTADSGIVRKEPI